MWYFCILMKVLSNFKISHSQFVKLLHYHRRINWLYSIVFLLTPWTFRRGLVSSFCDLTSFCIWPCWPASWLLPSIFAFAWGSYFHRFSDVVCVLKLIMLRQTLLDWGPPGADWSLWWLLWSNLTGTQELLKTRQSRYSSTFIQGITMHL